METFKGICRSDKLKNHMKTGERTLTEKAISESASHSNGSAAGKWQTGTWTAHSHKSTLQAFEVAKYSEDFKQAWKSMVYLKMVQKFDILRWKCLMCTAELSSQWSAVYHVRANHFNIGQTKYNCRFCPQVEVVSFVEILSHFESEHKLSPPLHRYYTVSRSYGKENSDPNANQPTVPNLNSSQTIKESVHLTTSIQNSDTQDNNISSAAEVDEKDDPNSIGKAQFLHYFRLGPSGAVVQPPVIFSQRRSSRVAEQGSSCARVRPFHSLGIQRGSSRVVARKRTTNRGQSDSGLSDKQTANKDELLYQRHQYEVRREIEKHPEVVGLDQRLYEYSFGCVHPSTSEVHAEFNTEQPPQESGENEDIFFTTIEIEDTFRIQFKD